MKTTLVIMAAGIGSRFKGGTKQLTAGGPNGETIMDYSIHDALAAGFNKIVFIIRKDLEAEFREIIGEKINDFCEVKYVFQELNDIPEGFEVPEGRKKPWGTGQAVLACREVVKEPFVVINADDYYGREAFRQIHDYLVEHADGQYAYCMPGFVLERTLGEGEGVTRGICRVSEDGELQEIIETRDVVKTAEGVFVGTTGRKIDGNSVVSMNMWGFTPEFIDILAEGFEEFFRKNATGNILKAEYLLPDIIESLLAEGKAKVHVLETQDRCFGVTYAEDKQGVADAFAKLVEEGVYPSPLPHRGRG